MKQIKFLLFFILIVVIYLGTISNSKGITFASTVGCGGNGCHGGAKNTATTIALTNNGQPFTSFVPGQKYTLTLTTSNANFPVNGTSAAGFDLKASSGTITAIATNTKIVGTDLTHSSPKVLTTGNTTSWDFEWTGVKGSKTVTFDVACNVVNGNGNNMGDVWNFTQFNANEIIVKSPPTITNLKANTITKSTADITASLKTNNTFVNTISLEYGLTNLFGKEVSASPANAKFDTTLSISSKLTALNENTLYYYRFKLDTGTNNFTYSAIDTFRTLKSTSSIINGYNSSSEILKTYFDASTSHLVIENLGNLTINSIKIVSIDGRLTHFVSKTPAKRKSLNLQDFPKGKYFILVDFEQSENLYKNSFMIY